MGNRKSLTHSGTTYFYCYNSTDCNASPQGNRLHTIRVGSPTGALHRQFSYDDSGRIVQKQTGSGASLYTINYNGKGRAQQINSQHFSYDPNDFRISKDDSLYHLEGEHLEATYSADNTLQNKYLRGVIVDEIVNGYHYDLSLIHI